MNHRVTQISKISRIVCSLFCTPCGLGKQNHWLADYNKSVKSE
ncbi:Uncharacterized protein dnm_069310 [Desulfonema magnum]|uniref:Uncharacterized protein n=1 Tax=Desulfonema magnum TaxID=45655 RepID=A0A975GRD4_9BACT|nr:Uncharacterized protein dnm_069310 [Desulfonema magnum]